MESPSTHPPDDEKEADKNVFRRCALSASPLHSDERVLEDAQLLRLRCINTVENINEEKRERTND
jgi:hypothetical protein